MGWFTDRRTFGHAASFSPLRTGRLLKLDARQLVGMTHQSDSLREEHEAIRHLLTVVDGMAARLEMGDRVPRADVESALDAIVDFADACLHAKEEKVLFGALRDLGTPRALLLVRELEGDHVAGRGLVDAMREEAGAAESGDPAGKNKLAHDARLYTSLLRRHLDHESRELLPLADSLPALTRDRVAVELDEVERAEVGAGTHERYERVVDALRDRYAPKGSSGAGLSQPH